MSETLFKEKLSHYIPPHAIPLVYEWMSNHNVKLKITKPRSSKLGDFRVNGKSQSLQISVNGNLNPYAFLITLTHEIAHMKDFEQRGHLRNAHGASWKAEYTRLLVQLVDADVFPSTIINAVQTHINSPKAASCSDPQLLNALRHFDEEPIVRLKDLTPGSNFALQNGRSFEVGQLRRTRYKCKETSSNRWFLIHGEAEVIPLD